ncbi:hypothetical protein [Paenibacillus sp. GP183]|uniref:hypothetical protein n=1 Tax=Paenibacillus sp. GP183 TaxID=1882751 RepID=UPI0008968A3F|nr:hypothetical protein [Paenibacillus sp. GP183]SEB52322.1 hypothetical protein SAMN05443246_0871 [Paenibacillus sp. GP183]
MKINPTFSQLNPLEQGRLNRGVSDQVRQKFEQITVERSQTKGVTDKQFLNSLNKDQLETLRTFHGLAFDIQTSQLSDEGAHNLVSETNDLRDLNGMEISRSDKPTCLFFLHQERLRKSMKPFPNYRRKINKVYTKLPLRSKVCMSSPSRIAEFQ